MSGMALPAVSAAMAGQSRAAGPALAIAHARPRAQLYFVDVGQAVADGFPDIRRADVLAAAHGYVVRHGIQILARREPCVQKSLGCRLYGKGTQQGCAAPPEFLRPDAFLPLRHGQTRQFSRYPSDGCTAYAAAVPGDIHAFPRRPAAAVAGHGPALLARIPMVGQIQRVRHVRTRDDPAVVQQGRGFQRVRRPLGKEGNALKAIRTLRLDAADVTVHGRPALPHVVEHGQAPEQQGQAEQPAGRCGAALSMLLGGV